MNGGERKLISTKNIKGKLIIIVSKIVDNLFVAKKATEFMPALPKNMKSSHIRVLDAIYKNHNEREAVRVSDVSCIMGLQALQS